LGKDPWGPDIKASDEFLEPLFEQFYKILNLGDRMRKADYAALAAFVPKEMIDPEITDVLDAIVETAQKAKPRGGML
ncbi:MAG: AAA family ATPase, partial [Candidatus Sumerlaeaceae bacterium]